MHGAGLSARSNVHKVLPLSPSNLPSPFHESLYFPLRIPAVFIETTENKPGRMDINKRIDKHRECILHILVGHVMGSQCRYSNFAKSPHTQKRSAEEETSLVICWEMNSLKAKLNNRMKFSVENLDVFAIFASGMRSMSSGNNAASAQHLPRVGPRLTHVPL